MVQLRGFNEAEEGGLHGGIDMSRGTLFKFIAVVVLVLDIVLMSFVAAVLAGVVPQAEAREVTYEDVTVTNLPGTLGGRSMDARPGDIDGDTDIDLIIATEYGTNKILINDGNGSFTDESVARLPALPSHDTEDIALVDFDGVNGLDILFVAEDDQTNELYFNDGSGFFTDESSRLGVAGTSNAVLAVDVDGDMDFDILIGNAGANVLLINDGSGNFTDESVGRLPTNGETTQDIEAGDVDGDMDLDLVIANEGDNQLLINNGAGFFTDLTELQLPLPPAGEETREADLADIDGDLDLDLFLANVNFLGLPAQNRLLLNDGNGFFSDVTNTHLPTEAFNTLDGDFVDIDEDGDADLLIANFFGGDFQVLINDGTGVLTDQTSDFLPPTAVGDGIDIEAADFNGDGHLDLYFCTYGFGAAQTDRLFLANYVDSMLYRYLPIIRQP